MRAITIEPIPSSPLQTLVIAPERGETEAPVILFLHGKGEAGRSPNDIPMVCVHQSPPWHALTGGLAESFVVAPQAPPEPDAVTWNWRDHVNALAAFVRDRFGGRRVVGAGFSRGGLGILQLLATSPDLLRAWAVVDPQPADPAEERAILASPAIGLGWLRYGRYRERSAAWARFASHLEAALPEASRDVTQLDHTDMALRAYRGESLSTSAKQNLYEFLQVRL